MLKVSLCAVALLLVAGCGDEQTSLEVGTALPGPTPEEQVGEKLAALVDSPSELKSFIKAMPKGGDLHSHLSGAVPMEKLIEWGAEDGVCVDTKTFYAAPGPCAMGAVPLSDAKADLELYSDVITAWSMQDFTGPLLAKHQHFFDAFGKSGAIFNSNRIDDTVAEIMAAAGANHQVYVEILSGLNSSQVGAVASKYMQPGDTWDEAYLLDKRAAIMADPVFKVALDDDKANIPAWISGARQILGCDGGSPDPGCGVEVRFLTAANRTRDKSFVFAQWVYGYELVQAAPGAVGVNLISPEENANSLDYYDDEMMAMDVLRRQNEGDATRKPVHVSLHAGELIQEVLPSTEEGQKHLTYHIERAVEVAHAERIGHGADLWNESDGDGPGALIETMRDAGVMVEICLESNNALLGVYGVRHPLRSYLKYGVPVALATDDQGILRTSITDDYVRAVTVQDVDYRRLKLMARASLEHAFIAGASLWAAPDNFYTVVSDCEFDSPLKSGDEISQACTAFLAGNERAALQWKLEGQLQTFESSMIETSP